MQRLSGKVGGIIYLDEIDKIGSLKSQGEWIRYQTTEMFYLLDRKFPKNLNDLDGDRLTEGQITAAEHTLKNNTLVLAGGAFQEIWDSSSIGFVGSETDAQPPDLNRLAQYIPTELSRRFGSQLVFCAGRFNSRSNWALWNSAVEQHLFLHRPFKIRPFFRFLGA